MGSTRIANKEVRTAERISEFPGIPLTDRESSVLRLFPGATLTEWEDWQWQIQNRIKTREGLEKVAELTEDEKVLEEVSDKFSFSITPYFASLIDTWNAHCPIRMQCIPRRQELLISREETQDPCGEEEHSPVHGLVHRYPDRVLFLVSEMCAMYCRFCTRSRMVGEGNRTLSIASYEAAFKYIRAHKEVRDVLISGGDPLMLGNDLLEYILSNIKSIPHVEFVRIGTRIPVTLPQRIDGGLIRLLKKFSPVWMSIHFNHSREITERVEHACNLLADNGIPLGSQTVLLKGINDSPQTMRELMHALLKIRVKPYYIYQCDPIVGSTHFRAPFMSGVEIIRHLSGFTTGYAVPTFVIDAMGGGGKIPVSPNYIVSQEGKKVILQNYEGQKFYHYDP